MNKIFVSLILALTLIAGVAFADQTWNLGQDRYYVPNPSTTRTVTANYTATRADHTILVNTTAGAITITLPQILNTGAGNAMSYVIANIGTTGYPVTVAASTLDAVTNTIEGQTSRILASPILGSVSYMNVALRTGYDWKVLWETPPAFFNMATGRFLAGTGSFQRGVVVSAPSVSTLWTAQDCGKSILVSTTSTSQRLPAAGAVTGCEFEFINVGAATTNNVDVVIPATDVFTGYINSTPSDTPRLITGTTNTSMIDHTTASNSGDAIRLRSLGTGTWQVMYTRGTWTTRQLTAAP